MHLLATAPRAETEIFSTPPAAKVGELHAPQLQLWRAFFLTFHEKTSKNILQN